MFTAVVVGPMSNNAGLEQLVDSVPYRHSENPGIGLKSGELLNVNEVEAFAAEYRKKKQGDWAWAESLAGFCLLLKREVLDKIGPALDDWSDLNLFDRDILGQKARQAGYSLAVCRDLFIHHFGTRMFVHGPAKASSSATAVR